FFVGPRWARRGLGRLLLHTCEQEARAAGFRTLELMATLPGVPFYAACGFAALAEQRDRLPNGVEVRFVPMQKELAPEP
ncbi:MAG TPA: GNAT family N-acetyltransferase, partial [Planctomycetota bacterium]